MATEILVKCAACGADNMHLCKQPTRDTIARTIWGCMFPEKDKIQWWTEDSYLRGKYLETADAVLALWEKG